MLDYLIVGGGVLGCAIGKTILEENPNMKILILEQFSGVGQGNTIRSNAAYRNIFDTTINIQLATSSIDYYKSMELEDHDFGRREIGYLFLLTESQFNEYNNTKIEHNGQELNFFDFLKSQNIGFHLYSKSELTDSFPELNLEPEDEIAKLINAKSIAYGFLGKDCGNFSPDLVVKHYYELFRELGGNIQFNTRVKSIKLGALGEDEFDPEYIPKVWEKNEVKALEIETSDGEIQYIQAKNFILATGAWINQLIEPLGSHSIIKPKKRQLFTIDNLKEFIANSNFDTGKNIFPFLILPTGGVFIKPLEHANCVVVGASDKIGRRFERNYNPDLRAMYELDDPKAEQEFFTYNILPVLQSYFPNIFDNIKALGSAGHYAYSIDGYPVVDKIEGLSNLFYASGASGSGIMKADSIARLASSLALGKDFAKLFNGEKIKIDRFGIKTRDLPDETLVL